MNPARLALSFPAVLALAACAPGEDDDGKRAPGPPIGFELAMAREPAPEPTAGSRSDERAEDQAQVIDLTPEQLAERMAAGDIMLVDVRTAEEVAEGMITGAVHIPLDQFAPGPDLLAQADGREIVLYCRSGRRSGIAGQALSAYLEQPVSHLAGGIIAWNLQTEALTAE